MKTIWTCDRKSSVRALSPGHIPHHDDIISLGHLHRLLPWSASACCAHMECSTLPWLMNMLRRLISVRTLPKKVEYFIFPIVIKHIENHIWPSVELFLKGFCSIFSIESAGLPSCQCVVLHFLMDGGWWLTLSIWGHLSLHDSLLSNTMANTRQSIYPQIKEIIYIYTTVITRLYCTYAIGLDVCNGNVLLFSDRCLQKLSTTLSSGKKCHFFICELGA